MTKKEEREKHMTINTISRHKWAKKTKVGPQGKPAYEFVASQVHTLIIKGKLNYLVQGITSQKGEHKCSGEKDCSFKPSDHLGNFFI